MAEGAGVGEPVASRPVGDRQLATCALREAGRRGSGPAMRLLGVPSARRAEVLAATLVRGCRVRHQRAGKVHQLFDQLLHNSAQCLLLECTLATECPSRGFSPSPYLR